MGMARKPRVVIPGFPHHVVLRGNNQRILFSRGDHEMFLFFVWRAIEQTGVAVNAATLMSNHVHLLVTPNESPLLSRFVKSVAQRYAQLRNEKREASGKLFEERFFSKPVLNELQLAIVTAYIHANPVRAGIVDDALDYPWSMHSLHAGDHLRSEIWSNIWTPSPWYESLGNTPWQKARRYMRVYRDYIGRGVEPEHVTELQILEAASMQTEKLLRRPGGLRCAEDITEYRVGSVGKILK
jgi:REP-associated tyrosine transposase